MELTRRFDASQMTRALESWRWIGLDGRTPGFTSPFGDVFFRAPDGIWWLDTLEGTLTRPWTNDDEMSADLATADGQDRYLLAGLALAAERQGMVPASDEVYNFTIPPILGGATKVDNIQTIGFVVALHITGQIHDQVRDLPPGTPITGFTIS